MTIRRGIISTVLILCVILAIVVVRLWWMHRNPYGKDGLHLEWNYGASSTVPAVEMWAESTQGRVACPISFHGLDYPDLRFYDYDGDGRRDIVFFNKDHKQVVSFTPGSLHSLPHFTILRNDVWWD